MSRHRAGYTTHSHSEWGGPIREPVFWSFIHNARGHSITARRAVNWMGARKKSCPELHLKYTIWYGAVAAGIEQNSLVHPARAHTLCCMRESWFYLATAAAAYLCKHRFDAARVQLQPAIATKRKTIWAFRPAARNQFDLRLNWRIMSAGRDGPCLNLNRLLALKAAAAFDFVLVASKCEEKLVLWWKALAE